MPFQWPTFLDTPPSEHVYERSRFVVIPVPYDGTASFRAGARYGPAAIIQASRHMEDFDVALGIDASERGIFTLLEATPDLSGPERMVAQVNETVARVVTGRKGSGGLGRGAHGLDRRGSSVRRAVRRPERTVLGRPRRPERFVHGNALEPRIRGAAHQRDLPARRGGSTVYQ